jgi:hypothetical protein
VSRAYHCEVCDIAGPHWVIERCGDAVVAWACDTDLAAVCERLQRDHEVTKLSVKDARKQQEWAGITRALDRIAGAP